MVRIILTYNNAHACYFNCMMRVILTPLDEANLTLSLDYNNPLLQIHFDSRNGDIPTRNNARVISTSKNQDSTSQLNSYSLSDITDQFKTTNRVK